LKFSPYIYEPKKSMDVLKQSEYHLKTCPEIEEKITELGWALQFIGKVIPQTTDNMWSGHFFPYTEAIEEFQVSFNLMLLGFYKQAFVSLRSSLELGLLSVYFNINDDGHQVVQDWLKSANTWEANTPQAKKIWSILLANSNIKSFNDKIDIKQKFDDLGYLHNYVHTKGVRYSNRVGLKFSNFQTFEERAVSKWLTAYEEIAVLVITLHMLKYPISALKFDWSTKVGIDNPFPVLEEFEIDRIEELLPEGYFEEIHGIALSDHDTQELYKNIVSSPDMTELEREDQAISFDKMSIEHGPGFIAWEKVQLSMMENWSVADKEIMQKRLKILKEWAIENNMMKSQLERLKAKTS